MKKLDTLESIMLALETPKTANHAGVLQVFQVPARSGRGYLDRVHPALLAIVDETFFVTSVTETMENLEAVYGAREQAYGKSPRWHRHWCRSLRCCSRI